MVFLRVIKHPGCIYARNAWQKFGSMNPEEAMEKYITLVSDKFPGWTDGHPSVSLFFFSMVNCFKHC